VTGYLELEPTACDTTPPGFGWLQVQPDGSTGEPNPPNVALRSSRTFNGCYFLNYNSAWQNGPSKVLLGYAFAPGCDSNPPILVFDFQPPPCGPPTITAWIGGGCSYSSRSGSTCTGAVTGGVAPYTYWWKQDTAPWAQGPLTQSFVCSSASCTFYFKAQDSAGTRAEDAPVTCSNRTCWFHW